MGGFSSSHLLKRYAPTEELDRELLKRLNVQPDELTPLVIAKIWRACRQDEDFFIFNFVRTKDEHDLDVPAKPLPNHPYLHTLLHQIRNEPVLYVEKSRQMMVTWIIIAHMVWKAKFRRNYLGFVQSKKQEDAANLTFNKDWEMARASFIELHLPPWMRSTQSEGTYGKLRYPTGSLIWGIPQGPDVLRSYTASEVFMDECAFWDAFQQSYQAALPMVRGGGNLVCVSSARPMAHFGHLLGKYEQEEEAA